jgi:hypothetical protein
MPELAKIPEPSPIQTPDRTKTLVIESRSEPKTTASPTPEIKIEPTVARVEPVSTPAPSPTPDDNTVAKLTDNARPENNKPTAAPTPKSIFEPIIITIPKSEAIKLSSSATTINTPTLELKRPNPNDRPRVVDGRPVNVIDPAPCQISVSQERLSLINNGGMMSVLVGVDKPGDLREIQFVVSDPKAISVSTETNFDGIQGRVLYLIRSISEQTGNYRITFYLPCGKKDLAVTVR